MDVVEWSRALDVRLSEWCCSVSMVWVQIPSREEQNLTALKSNYNTVWYIIFSVNLVSFKVTLRSSETDILYGCHLLLDVCIIYFISCDCIMNSSLSYTILKIAELEFSSIPRFSLRDKVTLRLRGLGRWVSLSEWCCSVSMVWVQIPSREEQKFDSSKI